MPICVGGSLVEANEKDAFRLFDRGQMRADSSDRDLRRLVLRKTVNAGRDCRKCDVAKTPCLRNRETRAIAAAQYRAFAGNAAPPNRPDGMDYMSGGQHVAAGQPGFSRRTAPERAAFGQKPRSGCAVDRTIDAATSEQRGIGGIDDRIDRQARDIAALQSDAAFIGKVGAHYR